MAYANVKAALVTHAATAAAAVTPPILDVKAGFPVPQDRCVRVWYGGETEPQRMGGSHTLNSEMVGKITMIGLFLPIPNAGDTTQAALIDVQGEAFGHALRTAVDADSDLATSGDNTTLEYAEPDLAIISGARYLVFTWAAVTDYIEYPLSK